MLEFRPTEVVEVETDYIRKLNERRAGHYLRGPIRISDIHAAGRTGARSALLLVAIHHRCVTTKQRAVTLPKEYLADWGLDRNAKWRGLKNLEKVGLVELEHQHGHTVVVKLRPFKKRGARA